MAGKIGKTVAGREEFFDALHVFGRSECSGGLTQPP
jgi:hypothetical protein